jgi:hypothetical protein
MTDFSALSNRELDLLIRDANAERESRRPKEQNSIIDTLVAIAKAHSPEIETGIKSGVPVAGGTDNMIWTFVAKGERGGPVAARYAASLAIICANKADAEACLLDLATVLGEEYFKSAKIVRSGTVYYDGGASTMAITTAPGSKGVILDTGTRIPDKLLPASLNYR